ncbi:N-6 DNA Methylase [Atopomonas hussainii]|uniref:site-specific DNA-methyltransferase (adenine-specific) n=1 Tax=Atopomonas hussainii TaxID=1429083 RepID=A0A1H7T166_9GAMM|nr:N-6 DNA methylase [Atopomonas hussainii]SEL78573.1 N-6 DNA Methylase [Atopomonas hussainii]
MVIDFFDSPQKMGISDGMLVRLDRAREKNTLSPDLLPYLDLIESSEIEMPDAVIQIDGRAVMYLVKPQVLGGDNVDSARLSSLVRVLACRGDARYLGVLNPGCLAIYPIGISSQAPSRLDEISLHSGNTALHDLLSGQNKQKTQVSPDIKNADSSWLDAFLFNLLANTAEQLRYSCSGLSDSEILSLIGRCLFVRFIADRKIISDKVAKIISPSAGSLDELLSSPESVSCTFKWLDQTFNGNILPLSAAQVNQETNYTAFFKSLGAEANIACNILNNIMRRAPAGQLQLFWDGILFQHVPADMLSQVYEHFAHAHQSDHAKSTSIHYTPRHIAQQLVDAAFAGIKRSDKDQAKVLDPASGAGVFLVLALKRLVQENWKRTGIRPSRHTIRNILNNQVYGLDINHESLKFAALSLYLTALELDPEPTPLEDLRFARLSEKTLIYVGEDSEILKSSSCILDRKLGSLSEHFVLPEELSRGVDLVIGNPPWTELGSTYKPKLDQQIRRIANSHKIDNSLVAQLKVDNGVPDIPFIWRALEWAKPGGMIAYALHAQHLLFRQGNGAIMRKALFQCLQITGILNASALRNEKQIWPNITAPFCFLVARNERPTIDNYFYYLSPAREKHLNDQALFRVDPQAATSISHIYAAYLPWVFKALARGSSLDLEVTAKIAGIALEELQICGDTRAVYGVENNDTRRNREEISSYWERYNLKNRDGVQNPSAKTFKNAIHLHGLPYLARHTTHEHAINTQRLPKFELPKLYSNYEREVFSAPLLLFRESPKKNRDQRGAIVSYDDLVYRETFFGYSCAGHAHPELLAKYLQLISLSEVFTYWVLMTSSKYGIERDAILKEDVDAFPIVPLERLSNTQVEEILRMSEELYSGNMNWSDLDRFVGKLYGLNRADQSVIKDTLMINLPYSQNKDYAEARPEEELTDFVTECTRVLAPFADRAGQRLEVKIIDHDMQAWQFICVDLLAQNSPTPPDIYATLATDIANHFWASQIRFHATAGKVIIGQIAQNRYWTKTRARLLALDLLNNDFIKHGSEKNQHGAMQ